MNKNIKRTTRRRFLKISAATTALGSMATYSGQIVTWEDALNSKLNLGPERQSFHAEAPVQPDADGTYPCAVPGLTKAF